MLFFVFWIQILEKPTLTPLMCYTVEQTMELGQTMHCTLRIGRTLQWKGERTCMTQGCFGPQNDASFEGPMILRVNAKTNNGLILHISYMM